MKAAIVALYCFSIVLVACVTTSESGRKQFIAVPDGQMNQMGRQAYADLRKKEKISKDQQMTRKMTEIGRRIAQASGKKFKWEFTLFDSKQVNAFCLPGGKIGVYRGIVPVAKTNAGLAAIMGHEVAHATLRHSAERASQTLVVSGVLITAGAAMNNPKKRAALMAALGLGAQFGVLLPFSRKHESEADTVGLKYMAKAGYDPAESVGLWRRMAKLGGTPPEFMSTHPDPNRRADELKKQLGSVARIYKGSAKQVTRQL